VSPHLLTTRAAVSQKRAHALYRLSAQGVFPGRCDTGSRRDIEIVHETAVERGDQDGVRSAPKLAELRTRRGFGMTLRRMRANDRGRVKTHAERDG
jgi:hypothetical protein